MAKNTSDGHLGSQSHNPATETGHFIDHSPFKGVRREPPPSGRK